MRRAACWALIALGCGFNSNDPWDDAEVVSLEDAPPPISGGTLTVTRDGRYAIAADSDRDRVVIVDLATHRVRSWPFERGVEPGRVVEGSSGNAFVVLRRGGMVAEIDLERAVLIARHPVCSSPRGLAWEPATERLHVACADGTLATLGASGVVERRLTLQPDLRDVVVTSSGLLVSRYRSARLVSVTSEGAVDPSGVTIPDATLTGIDENGDWTPIIQSYRPSVGVRLVATPGGAMLLHQRARIGAEAVFEGLPPPDPGVYTYSSSPVSGSGGTWRDPCGNAVVHTAATFVDGVGHTLVRAPSVARGVVPVDLAISAGGRMAIAFAGEPGGGFYYGPQVVSSSQALSVRDEPSSCVESERDDRYEGQVVAVAFAGETQLVQLRDPARLVVGDDVIELGGESVRDTGHDVFHLDTGGGIACASCHPEGGDDGHIWEFAAVSPVRTMALEGGVGFAPYHRAGDVPSFSDLMFRLSEQMAGPQLEPDVLDAVERWLRRLPDPAHGPVLDGAAVERGRAIFERADVGCASCHGGELGTDGLSHVVLGETWQTPSLRGAALRAPYLHDGRAGDLHAALSMTGADGAHGATGRLSAGELADLELYLLSR